MWVVALLLQVLEVVQSGPAVAAAIAGSVGIVVAYVTITNQSRIEALAAARFNERQRSRIVYECLPELYSRGYVQTEVLEVLAPVFGRNYRPTERVSFTVDDREKLLSIETIPSSAFDRVLDHLSVLPQVGARTLVSAYRRSDQYYERAIERFLKDLAYGGEPDENVVWQAMHSVALDLVATLDAVYMLKSFELLDEEVEFLDRSLHALDDLYGVRDPSWYDGINILNIDKHDWQKKRTEDMGHYMAGAVDAAFESPRKIVRLPATR